MNKTWCLTASQTFELQVQSILQAFMQFPSNQFHLESLDQTKAIKVNTGPLDCSENFLTI